MRWIDWNMVAVFTLMVNICIGMLLMMIWRAVEYIMRDHWEVTSTYFLLKTIICILYSPTFCLLILGLRIQKGYWSVNLSAIPDPVCLLILAVSVVWAAGTIRHAIQLYRSLSEMKKMVQWGSHDARLYWINEVEFWRKELKISQHIECREKLGIDSAFVMGVFHPVIYIPTGTFSEEEGHIMVMHECAHVKNRDLLWKTLVEVLRCVYWFLPATKWLLEEVNDWSEFRCDVFCCRRLNSSKKYFTVLIDLCLKYPRSWKSSWIASLYREKSELWKRIHAEKSNRNVMGWRRCWVTTIPVLFFIIGSIVSAGITEAALRQCSMWNESSAQLAQEDLHANDLKEHSIQMKNEDTPNNMENNNTDRYWNDSDFDSEIRYPEEEPGGVLQEYIADAESMKEWGDRIELMDVYPMQETAILLGGESEQEVHSDSVMLMKPQFIMDDDFLINSLASGMSELEQKQDGEEFFDTAGGLGNRANWAEGVEWIEISSEDEGNGVMSLSTNSITKVPFDWDLDKNTSNISKKFWRSNGSKLYFSCSTYPYSCKVRVGIVDPDRIMRYVISSGNFSHTFQLSKTGYYQFFISNAATRSVNVYGYYTK
ncbi:MAG: M56 family metallopeptidase [Clostridiales bacterium]|nr:M56 family metallopeptidase [Clostridiales bacterium]